MRWFGWAIHRAVTAYRETIYPIVYAITRFLPIRIPPWSIDAFFIAAFSLISAWRIRKKGGFIFGEDYRFWHIYGIYLPFWLAAKIGESIINMIDGILAFVTAKRIRIFNPLYDMLPNGMDDFVLGALSVSAVLLFFLGMDQVYLALYRN